MSTYVEIHIAADLPQQEEGSNEGPGHYFDYYLSFVDLLRYFHNPVSEHFYARPKSPCKSEIG